MKTGTAKSKQINKQGKKAGTGQEFKGQVAEAISSLPRPQDLHVAVLFLLISREGVTGPLRSMKRTGPAWRRSGGKLGSGSWRRDCERLGSEARSAHQRPPTQRSAPSLCREPGPLASLRQCANCRRPVVEGSPSRFGAALPLPPGPAVRTSQGSFSSPGPTPPPRPALGAGLQPKLLALGWDRSVPPQPVRLLCHKAFCGMCRPKGQVQRCLLREPTRARGTATLKQESAGLTPQLGPLFCPCECPFGRKNLIHVTGCVSANAAADCE